MEMITRLFQRAKSIELQKFKATIYEMNTGVKLKERRYETGM